MFWSRLSCRLRAICLKICCSAQRFAPPVKRRWGNCVPLYALIWLYVLVGVPTWFRKAQLKVYNSVVVLQGGQRGTTHPQAKLPNQAVFDELRYFTEGPQPELLEIQGSKSVCWSVKMRGILSLRRI